MSLIAKRGILFRAKTYQPGDTLPADNTRMVEAWLEAGSAEWSEGALPAKEPEEKPKTEAKKAKKGKK